MPFLQTETSRPDRSLDCSTFATLALVPFCFPLRPDIGLPYVAMAANTDVKTSLEITKGATMTTDPISVSIDASSTSSDDDGRRAPTEEEWATLPRVAGNIPWQAWTVAAVEFVERFSYYGTSAVFVSKLAQATYIDRALI